MSIVTIEFRNSNCYNREFMITMKLIENFLLKMKYFYFFIYKLSLLFKYYLFVNKVNTIKLYTIFICRISKTILQNI